MLQWMGGSRRKVNTSRKSTHKRQKQYFEQKKRQQQQQSESYVDGMNSCSHHPSEHRSLDVLSLLNLSTASHEFRSACASGKEDLEVRDSTVEYGFQKGLSTYLTHTVTPAGSVECKETRSPSHCQVEAVSPKKDLLCVPHSNNTDFNGAGSKLDLWKTATEQQLSILDLVDDDKPNGNKERSPMYEAHAAFSVEGLGKVGTETPVHSPRQPGRYSSFGYSSPLKAAKQLNMSNNRNNLLGDLELKVDTMMRDINIPLSGSSLKFSSDIKHSHSNSTKNLADVGDFLQDAGHYSQMNCFGDRSIFYGHEKSKEDMWDAKSCFLDNNFLDEREYDVSWKNWPPQIDGNPLEFWNYGNTETPDYAFEGPPPLKKRDAATAADKFNILVSSASFRKHQKSEDDLDVMPSNRARCATTERKFDFSDVTGQSEWFCFASEDARDNLSMLSEESCSSSAVRGEATNNPQSKSAARQGRRQRNAFTSPQKEHGVNNVFAEESRHKDRNIIRQGNVVRRSGKCTNMPKLSNSKPSQSNFPLKEELGSKGSWFYGKGYTSATMDSLFSPISRNSETKITCSGSKLWTENPSSTFPLPELDNDAKSSFGRSKLGESLACSHSGSFISEKFTFHDSRIFPEVEFGPKVPDLSLESELEGTPPESSHWAGSNCETPFPDISTDESASKDGESKAKFQPADSESLELKEEMCRGNGLFSGSEKELDALCSKSKSWIPNEPKDEAPEVMDNLKTYCSESPDHAEQASTPLMISAEREASIEEQEHHQDDEASLQCQNGNKEIQVPQPQGRRKTESNCDNSPCQVMMLEGYVLQLLSVQKVLKDTSAQYAKKKVQHLHD